MHEHDSVSFAWLLFFSSRLVVIVFLVFVFPLVFLVYVFQEEPFVGGSQGALCVV